jgi:apolipoprotein N-acyltransferase
MKKDIWVHLAAAVTIGLGLRFVVGLEPVWWLAWFVPGLLLALALRTGSWASRGYVAIAAAIGVTVNVPFFQSVMPPVPLIIVMALQVLLWMLVIGVARRIMLRFESGWSVLALPIIGVAADTALAHFTPDGNWGSLAYTQAEVLPIAQLASLFGVGGVLFLLLLFNGAVGLAVYQALRPDPAWRGTMPAYTAAAAAFVAAAAFGWWRLQAPDIGKPVSFGIVSIDDFLRDARSEQTERVWQQYGAQVAALAAGGAKIVLLPEKINVLPADIAERLKKYLGQMARDHKVWLVAGLGVDTGTERRNEAWWFAPGAGVRRRLRVPGEHHRRGQLCRGHLQGHALRQPGARLRATRRRRHAGAGLGLQAGCLVRGEHHQDARHRKRLRRGAFVT